MNSKIWQVCSHLVGGKEAIEMYLMRSVLDLTHAPFFPGTTSVLRDTARSGHIQHRLAIKSSFSGIPISSFTFRYSCVSKL